MQAYLTFNGNAAEALAFYAKCLDGKILFSMTFGESPMGKDTPAALKDKIMHATLEARGHQIMASDAPPEYPFEGYKGFSLSVQAKNVQEGEALFKALGAGGKVTMPFGPQFWSTGFGVLEDKFGVPWMINTEEMPAKS
ncbi:MULTISPECIES: VOC family protein [unclassified Variovorax]|uniref:VOC family protein n=1 Tax=unclassified Variovorax TaxID=663243 RepID=UPI001317DF12|nr:MULTISPECIES: VOC family protein [unclassified Variovorax]VTU14865.1 3-demethylubiquinone-9 3-methyltransferase [Variovorax sp. SRS16]VTU21831.1 3-demethylubiquinone-9 3-methyltransferase [Variovorax sp. PBL-E5]